MSFTPEQSSAVSSHGKVIVSASAGSGKTFVMIERLASLIESGVNIENILAVTFTNKAAAQMRERARKKLTEAYRSAQGEQKARLRAQIEALPLADISTIHAFCGRLVRTYFYLLGVDPRFRIASGDSAEGKALCARAVDEVFERAYAEGGAWFEGLLKAYFRKKKDKQLREILLTMYSNVRNVADYRTLLEQTAAGESGDAAEESFEKLASFLAEDIRLRAGYIYDKTQKLLPMSEVYAPKATSNLEAIAQAVQALAGEKDLFSMQECAASFALARNPSRSAKDAPETAYVLGQLQALAKECKALFADLREQALAREEEFARFASGRALSNALARLVLWYDETYSALKRDAGVLDYGDLEHFALAVLKSEEVRAAVREKYSYIFVDEYQDVNPLQSAILEAVAGEEIFLVGDKKQAIYGFRGSRAKFFTEKETAFGGALPLDKNFRSAPVILDAVNCVFTSALSGYIPMAASERYAERGGEVCVHTALPEEEEEGAVRGVYSVAQATEKNTKNAVAEKVLAIVEAEHAAGQWYDADENAEKAVSYGDIAVLVRKNTTTAGAVVRALSERGIPVSASAKVNICDYFEVHLLIDWLSYLDNPEQDIPMATAMLSAVGGFSDRELALIRLKVEKTLKKYRLSFRAACRAYLDGYRAGNDPLCKKLEAFFARAEHYRALSRVKTASEILSLLLADGLEAQIAAKGKCRESMARVRRLIAESGGAGSVHDFLKRLKASGERIDFSESGGEGAVKVLTIHASKGLEYPVVILLDLDTAFHGVDKDETMWTDEFGISPKCFDFENKTHCETLSRRAAEVLLRREEIEGERNLLYVAMTRAKYRLHMVFTQDKEQVWADAPVDVTYSPYDAGRFSDFIPREKLTEFTTRQEAQERAVVRRALVYRSDYKIVAALEVAAKPYPFAKSVCIPVKDSATGLMQRQSARTIYVKSESYSADMGGGFSAETGSAYHAFLEHVRFGEDADEELARMERAGILTKTQLALLDGARLKQILSIPCLAALKGKNVKREQKFLVTFPAEEFYDADEGGDVSVVFQGALDLLAEDEKGYHIIDYKFSSHDDERIRRDYAVQMKLYKKTVAKIMRVREETVRVTIVNIAAGREIPV